MFNLHVFCSNSIKQAVMLGECVHIIESSMSIFQLNNVGLSENGGWIPYVIFVERKHDNEPLDFRVFPNFSNTPYFLLVSFCSSKIAMENGPFG